MISRKAIFAIILAALLLSLGGYTLVSYSGEPHPLSPVTTGRAFAVDVANVSVSYFYMTPTEYGTYYTSSPSTLFFHNFSLDGSNASFGFSLSLSFPVMFSFGGATTMTMYMTKVAQSIAFPHFGTLMLQVFALNATIEFNGTTDYNIGYYFYPGSLTMNGSVAEYTIGYVANIPFGTNETFVKDTNHGILVNSYNVTYSVEVAPVLEFGPYYLTGPTQWLSHTFQVPFISG